MSFVWNIYACFELESISGDVHVTGHLMTYGRIEQPSDVIRYTVHMKCAERGVGEDCNWKPFI